MMNLFRTSVVVLGLMLTTQFASANEKPSVDFNKVELTNAGTVDIKLFDNKGTVIYSEVLNGASLIKEYDFTQLPTGDYYMSVDANNKKIAKWFSVEKGNVINTSEKVYYRPSIRVKNSDVYISKFALDKNVVTVQIFDENGFEIFEGSISSENDHGKSYDLSALPKGDYKVVASNGGFRMSQNVDIK
ncbi:MAG: hypothetical protein ACPGRE_01445 [Flavobacteriaceae bacterium]